MNNKELVFAQTLEKVRKTAKEQGNCITEQQVQEAFAALELSGEQLQLVYDYLVKHKVGIGQPVNAEDYLSDEERNYLQDYLDELDGLEALSEGEKEAVTISAMAGEADAQAKLIEIFLHEVVEIAKIYTGMGVYLEDLIGEGNVALTMGVSMLGCVETPAEAQGMLAKLIMDAMEELVAENAEVQKADKKIEDRVNKVMKKANELSEELRRKVSVAELSKESGMSESYIREAVRFSGYKIDAIEEDAT